MTVTIVGLLVSACSQPATGPIETDGTGSLWSDAAKAAERRWSPDADLTIEMQINLVDPYGNGTSEPALDFLWSRQELARINPDAADGWRLLNLADVTIRSQRGVIALAEWCEDRGRTLTPRLCRDPRSAAEDRWALRFENRDAKPES
jgi:hypothetical protein